MLGIVRRYKKTSIFVGLLLAAGFYNKYQVAKDERLAEEAGFSSVFEMEKANRAGFDDKESYSEYLREQEIEEAERAEQNRVVAREAGFISVEEMKAANEVGAFTKSQYESYLERQAEIERLEIAERALAVEQAAAEQAAVEEAAVEEAAVEEAAAEQAAAEQVVTERVVAEQAAAEQRVDNIEESSAMLLTEMDATNFLLECTNNTCSSNDESSRSNIRNVSDSISAMNAASAHFALRCVHNQNSDWVRYIYFPNEGEEFFYLRHEVVDSESYSHGVILERTSSPVYFGYNPSSKSMSSFITTRRFTIKNYRYEMDGDYNILLGSRDFTKYTVNREKGELYTRLRTSGAADSFRIHDCNLVEDSESITSSVMFFFDAASSSVENLFWETQSEFEEKQAKVRF